MTFYYENNIITKDYIRTIVNYEPGNGYEPSFHSGSIVMVSIHGVFVPNYFACSVARVYLPWQLLPQ